MIHVLWRTNKSIENKQTMLVPSLEIIRRQVSFQVCQECTTQRRVRRSQNHHGSTQLVPLPEIVHSSVCFQVHQESVPLSSASAIRRKTAGNLSPLFLVTFFPSSVLSNSFFTTGSEFCKNFFGRDVGVAVLKLGSLVST